MCSAGKTSPSFSPVTPVADLPNLGPACSIRLQAVGIHNLKDLREMGAVGAYCLVKNHGYPTSLNLLWAIYGALNGMKWNEVPDEIKSQLKSEI
jgi:DNA transformation protein and related proteins